MNSNENEVIIVDELGNEIVDGLEVTIPADIAEENGAHEEDAHESDNSDEDSIKEE